MSNKDLFDNLVETTSQELKSVKHIGRLYKTPFEPFVQKYKVYFSSSNINCLDWKQLQIKESKNEEFQKDVKTLATRNEDQFFMIVPCNLDSSQYKAIAFKGATKAYTVGEIFDILYEWYSSRQSEIGENMYLFQGFTTRKKGIYSLTMFEA